MKPLENYLEGRIQVKPAIVMILLNCTYDEAIQTLIRVKWIYS